MSWTPPANNGSAITRYETRRCRTSVTDCVNTLTQFQWVYATHAASATSVTVTVKWLSPVEMKVQLQACNSVGCSGWSKSGVGLPGRNPPVAPSAPTLTAGNARLGVSWTVPTDTGGSAITGFGVQYCDTDASNASCGDSGTSWSDFTFTSTGSTTATTITSLTNGNTYKVRVRAINAIGNGEWSDAVSEKVGLAPAAPVAPTLTAGNASVGVSWTAPSDNGGLTISGFGVQYCDTDANNASCGDSGTSWQTFTFTSTGSTTSTSVTGLTNGNAYKVRVRAINAIGNGSWSPASSQTAGVPAVPAAPTVTLGDTSVDVEWTAPANNGSALSGFGVQYCDTDANNASCGDSGTSWQTWTFTSTGSTTETTITGLTNGHTYKVRVRAANTHGSGGWSPTGSATPATVPDAPAAPTLAVQDKSLGVTWAPPSDNGGAAITDYDVQYRKQNSDTTWPQTWTSHAHTGTATTTTISNLTNLSQYQVQVRALNDYNGDNTNDAGEWSASATATPDVAPAAPTAPTLTVKHQSLDVEWSAPTGNGGSAVTGYQVRRCDNSTGCDADNEWTVKTLTGTGTTTTVTGLTNGTTYQVQVAAVNNVGTGAWSSSATAVPATVPTAPAAPTLTVKNESLGVRWSAPSGNGGSAVTGYKVGRCSSSCGTDSNWTVTTLTGTGTSTTLSSLTNGTAYQVRVAATNSVGTGAWSSSATATPAKKPEAPAAPTLTKGARSLTVSWTAPTNNGAAISDYNVQYRACTATPKSCTTSPSWGSWQSRSHTGTTTTTTISNLTNGTAYQVQVQATNSQGSSGWSPSATAAPEDKPAAPAAPTLTSAVVSQQISVSWTAPANNGQAISDYDVQYRACTATDKSCTTSPSWGNWTSHTHTGTTTTATISNLTNGTAYQVQVRATNSVGTGDWSSSATDTPATTPGAPAAPTLTAKHQAVGVTWAAPSDTGGSAVTGYKVQYCDTTAANASCSDTSGTTWQNWSFTSTGATTATTVTGLTTSHAYKVRVRAVNRAGDGTWSPSSTATPAPQKPDTPSAPTLTSSNKSLGVTWTAPTANGSAITDYDVQYRACTATDKSCTTSPTWGSWQSWSHTGTTTTTTISNLTNGTAYQVQVQATNGIGDSSWSSSASAIPLTTPAAPARPTVTAGADQLEVEWSVPSDNGGTAITGFKVRRCDQSTGCDATNEWTAESVSGGATTIHTITGLTNGTTYRVQVAAVNSVGTGAWSQYRTGKPVDKPSQPGDLDVVSGPRSLTVSWTASNDNGSTITRYNLRYCDTSDSSKDCYTDYDDWTKSNVSGATTSTTFTGLTNNNSYSVEVQAKNAVGESEWASSSGTPGAPGKPTLSLTTPTAGGQIKARWSAPSQGHEAISGYDVESCNSTDNDCTDSNNWDSANHSDTTTSNTITGLTNGKAYKVRVRATNSVGSGVWSSEVTATPLGKPAKPDAPTLAIKDRGIDVTWSAPSDTGGAPITSFKVRHRVKDTNSTTPGDQPGNWTTKSVSGATTTTTSLTGLTNGTAYQVQVAAVNRVDTGSWSDSTDATPVAKLAKPTLEVKHEGLVVSWTAPTDDSSTVTGYNVQYRACTATPKTCASSPTWGSWSSHDHWYTTTTTTIDNLTNGTAYEVQVQVTRDSGNSPWSGSASAIPKAVPDAPDAPTLTAGDQQISIEWSEPTNNNGSAVTDYDVRYRACTATPKSCETNPTWGSWGTISHAGHRHHGLQDRPHQRHRLPSAGAS